MIASKSVFKRNLHFLVLSAISLLAVLAGCHTPTEEERSKAWFDHQVAAIKSGKTDWISMYDIKGADALLQGIVGLAGVKNVSVEFGCDIGDAGFTAIAQLPDLTHLSFYRASPKDKWLELLQPSPNLEEIDLSPEWAPTCSLSSMLALPHLRRLRLEVYIDPRERDAADFERWVDAAISQLQEATKLEQITFEGEPFVQRKPLLAKLQDSLSECKITLLRDSRRSSEPISLTDGDE